MDRSDCFVLFALFAFVSLGICLVTFSIHLENNKPDDQSLVGQKLRSCCGECDKESALRTNSQHFVTTDREDLLDAIRVVETGGEPDGGIGAIGDGGKSYGPYQISKAYWADAVEWDGSLSNGSWELCLTDADYSRRVVLAYWNRYAEDDAPFEVLARLHNGGPMGHSKSSTIPYWEKVKSVLEKE